MWYTFCAGAPLNVIYYRGKLILVESMITLILVSICRTGKVTLTNFGLSKHLVRGGDLLTDQRGSPAYVSPDVLSGECFYCPSL